MAGGHSMIRRLMLGALAACLFALPVPVSAGLPTEQLRSAIDRVVKTLDNPALKGEARVAERRAAVRKIANDIFDFPEIARRSLGRHWAGKTDAEHEEFVGLFADLLERSYIAKIDSKSGTEVPVDYRMLKKGDRWLVYDVSIEGVSLVSNYRTQFNKIIQTSSYAELIKKMKRKQQGDFTVKENPGTNAKTP